jgi:carboxymethylenebutenolidase
VVVAAGHLRSVTGVTRLFTTGFCMGGRLTFLSAGFGLGLAGVVGFYGWPVGPARNDTPAPAEVADTFECPVLGIFGGADQGIPADAVARFERALAAAGVPHRLVSYPNAPHSFFDRKAEEFAAASAVAWGEVLAFIRGEGGPVARRG